MSSIEEKKEFDDCLPVRLIYESLSSVSIYFPYWKFDQYCYISNKVKEAEVNLKISTEIASNEIINCMKRTAKYHNVDFDNADVSELYKMMIDDYKSYSEFKQDQSVAATSANIIDNIVVKFNKIITIIDRIIVKLSTAIKSVESEDPQLNKVNYVDILNFECYNTFSEEQNKLIREGKDVFSKEMLSVDIKMLRTFKSRVLRIFNKYFGKDSYFGPLNKQDACR